MDRLLLRTNVARGGLYIALSLLFFLDSSLMLTAGIWLFCAGVLNLFAHINKVTDANDAAAAASRSSNRSGETQPLAAKGFGTF